MATHSSSSSHFPFLWDAERLVEEQELVMAADGTFGSAAPMLPINRPVGQNDVGIVSWLLTLRTPECPQGRKVGGSLPTLESLQAFS